MPTGGISGTQSPASGLRMYKAMTLLAVFVTVGNCRCRAGLLLPGDSDLTLQLIHMAFRQRGCSIGMAFREYKFHTKFCNIPTLANSTTATFADDTVILTVHEDPTMAAHRLQMHLNKIQSWLKTWRIKANEAKSVQVTFTLNKMTCLRVKLDNECLPQADEVST